MPRTELSKMRAAVVMLAGISVLLSATEVAWHGCRRAPAEFLDVVCPQYLEIYSLSDHPKPGLDVELQYDGKTLYRGAAPNIDLGDIDLGFISRITLDDGLPAIQLGATERARPRLRAWSRAHNGEQCVIMIDEKLHVVDTIVPTSQLFLIRGFRSVERADQVVAVLRSGGCNPGTSLDRRGDRQYPE